MKYYLLIIFLFIVSPFYSFTQVNEVVYGDTTTMYETYDDEIKGFEFDLKQELQDGVWIVYWDETKNSKAIEGRYRKGIRHGIFTFYYKSGEIKEILSWKKGKPHGVFEEYYENGKLKVKGKNKTISGHCKGSCSKPIGKWIYYNDKGEIIKEKKW